MFILALIIIVGLIFYINVLISEHNNEVLALKRNLKSQQNMYRSEIQNLRDLVNKLKTHPTGGKPK